MPEKKISDDAIVQAKITDSGGIVIELKSTVKHMFGKHIIKAVETVVKEFKYKNMIIIIDDYGALDFCIRARTRMAIKRASKNCKIYGD